MTDMWAHKRAHKLERCPACGGMMRLGTDTYKCESCEHFKQDIGLHDIIERDDPVNLKFCHCAYCLKESGGEKF